MKNPCERTRCTVLRFTFFCLSANKISKKMVNPKIILFFAADWWTISFSISITRFLLPLKKRFCKLSVVLILLLVTIYQMCIRDSTSTSFTFALAKINDVLVFNPNVAYDCLLYTSELKTIYSLLPTNVWITLSLLRIYFARWKLSLIHI